MPVRKSKTSSKKPKSKQNVKKRTSKRNAKKRTSKRKASKASFGKYDNVSPQRALRDIHRTLFGKLEVPAGVRPVSDYRGAPSNRPLITMPFGPPQPWIMKPPQEAAESTLPSQYGRRQRRRQGFGFSKLNDQYVNPSGYLSTWYSHPMPPPPSWNPLLRQGGNMYNTDVSYPKLSNVLVPNSYGRRRRHRKQY